MHIQFAGSDLLTGLPEYRNGGLLVDTGLLTLKRDDMLRGIKQYKENAKLEGQPSMEVVPLFTTDDDVIVEWRAATVGFLDDLLDEVNRLLGLDRTDGLTLAQMLEAGTWKVRNPTAPSSTEPVLTLIITAGWSRTRRGVQAEHEGASYNDLIGRDRVLRYPAPPCSLSFFSPHSLAPSVCLSLLTPGTL